MEQEESSKTEFQPNNKQKKKEHIIHPQTERNSQVWIQHCIRDRVCVYNYFDLMIIMKR